MKKFKRVLLFFLLAIVAAACQKHHRIIESHSNKDFLKIEYAGNIYFNESKTAIINISPGGYVKYESNDNELEAKKGSTGRIIYKLSSGGRKLNADEAEGKAFIASAVQDMVHKGSYTDKDN